MTLEEAKKEINKNQSSPTIACNRDYDSGWEDAIFKVIEILEQVDTVPVPKDTMTLKELARELRKVFIFDYVTIDDDGTITSWRGKPLYISTIGVWDCNAYLGSLDIFHTDISCTVDLDLSEYADENGEIDYSKCIVEVE